MKMTPAEMNEQVALRLAKPVKCTATDKELEDAALQADSNGYWCCPGCLWDSDYGSTLAIGEPLNSVLLLWRHSTVLPTWSTDDGLAFQELWPRIADNPICIQVSPSNRPCVSSTMVEEIDRAWVADTWAEAICAAFIELVPLPEEEK